MSNPIGGQELSDIVSSATSFAFNSGSDALTVEHLLLTLLDNPSAAEVLKACGADINDMRASLISWIDRNQKSHISPFTVTASKGEEIGRPPLMIANNLATPTVAFHRVIQRATVDVKPTVSSKKEITGANVLVAIFCEKDSHVVQYLYWHGVTRLDVVNFITSNIKKSELPTKMALALPVDFPLDKKKA